SLVGWWWEGPGATHCPLRGRIQQLVATPVDLVTEYPTVGVHSDLIRDVALAFEIIGIALVTWRRFVYRPFRPLQLGGDPVLDRIGIGRGDRSAAYRCRVRRRGGRGGGPLLVGAKAMHRRAGRRCRAWRNGLWRCGTWRWRGCRFWLWLWLWLWFRLGLGLWFRFRFRGRRRQFNQFHGHDLSLRHYRLAGT